MDDNFKRIVESTIFITLIKWNTLTPKIVLTTTGILMLLHVLLFFFGADDVAISGVTEKSKKALRVWIGLAEIVARVSLFLGIVLIFGQDIEITLAKIVLSGTGMGYLFLIAGFVKYMINFKYIPEVVPPITSVIIVFLLAVWLFYVAIVKKNTSE